MNRSIFVVTGTDTGVGKTVLTCLLARELHRAGIATAALKPLCSGSREDARRLRAATDRILSLPEINPWFFRAPVAPLVAARRERRKVTLAEVLAHVRKIQPRFQTVLVEGAGGLLSPLGEGFDSRDLILALRATPIVVCPNRLGAINQTLLVLEALPARVSRKAQVALVTQRRPDSSSRDNPRLLAEKLGAARVHVLPRLRHPEQAGCREADRTVSDALRGLVP